MGLLGRVEECLAVDAVLTQARAGVSGVLVLRGDPGIGKSSLLRHAAESAPDMGIAAVTGVEAEGELGFAALHRLLTPFLSRRAALPRPQRDALGAAFGLVAGVRADRFLIGLAALNLLAEVATERPVLCLCDDAQWVDRETLGVLAFLGRRLDADRIAMLFTVRDGHTTPLDDLPTLRIEGLPVESANALVRVLAPGRIGDHELARVVAETGGNPLAIRELAREWNDATAVGHLGGRTPLAQRLPLGDVLTNRFLARVRELAEPVQTLVLVIATDPTGNADLVWRVVLRLDAAGGAGTLTEAAEPARVAELLTLDPVVGFRHPLMRSAIYGGATTAARRQVHGAISAVLAEDDDVDIDRYAWHLAASTSGPDDRIAGELARGAERARVRAGFSAEAAFLAAAAERTIGVALRAQRWTDAGVAAMNAGLPHRAIELLDRTPHGADVALRARAALARGAACLQLDRFDEGVSSMFAAARDLGSVGSTVGRSAAGAEALLDALQAVLLVPWLDKATRRLVIDTIGSPPAGAVTSGDAGRLLAAHSARLTGDHRGAGSGMPTAVAALRADLSVEVVIRWLPFALAAAEDLLDDGAVEALAESAVRVAREHGAVGALRTALHHQAVSETRAGRFDLAEVLFAEFAQISAVVGGTALFRRPQDVLLRAWQGDAAGVQDAADSLPEPPDGTAQGGVPVQMVRTGLAILALGSGRYTDALSAARQVFDDDPPYWGHIVLSELVEAGVRGGDREVATDSLRRLTDRVGGGRTGWALGLLARSRALLAADADAEALHREAVHHLSGSRVATELARAHLLHGEWLRRRRRRADARRELDIAHGMFTGMGAAAFADRARGELVAAGVTVRRRSRDAAETLTAHEARIARLAGGGATNQQIGTELFISPNTVDYHLRKVFRKLGVTSRHQLDPAALEPSAREF